MQLSSKKMEYQTLSLRSKYAKDFHKNWQLYVMILLPIVYILIFAYMPMYGLQIAFRNYNALDGIMGSKFVGLMWFKRFFNSPWFWRYIGNTLAISVYNIALSWPLPIFLALCFHVVTNKIFKNSVQFISYLPHFISTVVLVGMINVLFGSRTGLLGRTLEYISQGQITNVLSSASAFRHLYVWSGIWQNVGWSTIIYMAALTSVSKDQTEAALIDGASRFQRVIHVDIPTIMPTMVIQLLLLVGSVLNVGEEKVLLMQNDLNLAASEVISTYSFKTGLLIGSGNYSFGAAIGFFNSFINLIVLLTVNKVSKKVFETSLW